MKILVVEDEPKLNEFLRKGLEQHGYVVDSVANGAAALEAASVNSYDAMLLDIMLPGQSGLEVLDNLRQFGLKTPVIILSALANSNHVINALDRGAADYIKKPFDFGELLARIRALTRKGEPRQHTLLMLQALKLDRLSRKVFVADREVELTKREFLLLEHLMANCNRVISKTEIAEKVWEINFDSGSNVIEVHMSALRKKIGEEMFKTKVGLGYFMEGELTKK